MGRRRNKLRNAAGRIGLPFFRLKYRIVKIVHIGSRTRYEDQFLYAKIQFILVPPHFQLVPPHYVCSGDGTGSLVSNPDLIWLIFFTCVSGCTFILIRICKI